MATDPLQPLTGEEETFLRTLGRVIQTVPRAMDADLVREQRLTLTEYMTLMHLSEAPCRRLRMSELAMAVDLSLSGMTRLVTRLTTDGLVERVQCEEDGRGFHAVLTAAGLARLEQAYPTHLASVRRHIFDQLDRTDLARLTPALQRVGIPADELPTSC
ncbi:MarR family transcriptional regulator [Microtetraspora sp. NBRC 13810]|uniref:MarR family winged helix-turn-helix transcriptional regulator n=1 Tax=Microtetraspora sp. NBRC 13810 TaxID=3030990 RepID=UPI002555B257|nr:MarR family transcriptional regulator [Microtetraspora sp. NBRC 13810]